MDDYNNMGTAARHNLCMREKTTIKSILSNNEMTMTNVVKDKVRILYEINALGPRKLEWSTEQSDE